MSQDYQDIGLGGNLFKQTSASSLDKIDPDTQIDDGAIQGIKLMTKSVSLDKLYGQDLVVGGGSNISGSILVNDSSNISRITMDATNGLTISDNSGDVFSAVISGSNAGQVTIGNYPTQGLRFDTSGNLTINGSITATSGTIGGWTINPGSLSSGSITLNSATSTISGGTIDGSTIKLPNETLGTGNAGKLIWASNARIWGDSGGNIGINGVGGQVIIYCNSSQIATFSNSGQANLSNGLNVSNGNFNVSNGDARFRFNLYTDFDNIGFGTGGAGTGGSKLFTLRDFGVTISNNGGNRQINFGGNTFLQIGIGSTKTAIVPTSKGYRALYTNESPEVWFNDFCKGKRVFLHKGWKFWKWGFDWEAQPDPTFMEVTSAPYVIIPTATKGVVQVWGKRKGYENTRFEEKTKEEFEKNNKFWNQAKIDNEAV